MRRKGALLLSLAGLLTASTLGASAATASSPSAPADAGWEVVDNATMNEMLAEAGAARLSAADEEPEELPWAIESVGTGLFVASEQSYRAPNTGLLRARSEEVGGSWELFDLYWDDATETLALRSTANDLFVASEQNYTGSSEGILRARSAGSAGSWERFVLWTNPDTGRYALRSVANDLFVATEQNYTGDLNNALRARSDWINGSWEEFYLY
ncbi:fascin domain-containing protein [Streptomyces sp. SBT349]|uniref:fascin domain-containing protein n=1 Tax=Streptomyces sp. SBT349 TaxID=1580539 RepID=UPI00066A4760|nr:hypothetical protein [Streptomyces sp. SBT349]